MISDLKYLDQSFFLLKLVFFKEGTKTNPRMTKTSSKLLMRFYFSHLVHRWWLQSFLLHTGLHYVQNTPLRLQNKHTEFPFKVIFRFLYQIICVVWLMHVLNTFAVKSLYIYISSLGITSFTLVNSLHKAVPHGGLIKI